MFCVGGCLGGIWRWCVFLCYVCMCDGKLCVVDVIVVVVGVWGCVVDGEFCVCVVFCLWCGNVGSVVERVSYFCVLF